MNFDLFETALKNYEQIEESKKTKYKEETKSEPNACDHKHVILKNGTETCTTCGELLKTKIMHDKEWRCYSNSGKKDPNRVQIRKVDDRNIFKDVQGLGFSNKIVSLANDLYSDVSKGKILQRELSEGYNFCVYFSRLQKSRPPSNARKINQAIQVEPKSWFKRVETCDFKFKFAVIEGGKHHT